MHKLNDVINLVRQAQEAGAQPGAPLSVMNAILLFVGVPIALFAVITLAVLLFTSSRKKSSQITQID
jgi:hypothetical protein